jgi:hypothetical protein
MLAGGTKNGYSVSRGYLIDSSLENLVYIPALISNLHQALNSEGGDIVQRDSGERIVSNSGPGEAHELHLCCLPSPMNPAANSRNRFWMT